mgnify:CR=1 FL=1
MIILILACFFRMAAQAVTLRFFEMNIWQEGTMVKDGFKGIVDEIVRSNADIVVLCEVRNYNGVRFTPKLVKALETKGVAYHGNDSTNLDVAVLSKGPISEQTEVFSSGGSVLRCITSVLGQDVAVYAAHLDYTNYACYLPRGYDGVTWKPLDAPVTDSKLISQANRLSTRDEGIRAFLDASGKDIAAGRFVFLSGDFNEPSHLDWKPAVKELWDHHGAVVEWDCSSMLYRNGFKDAYRMVHPNVKSCPGFTFPADNNLMPVSRLSWAPKADERDRIDYIYYRANKRLRPVKAVVVGPRGSIVRSKRVMEESNDEFLLPVGVWPTDHKAVLVDFSIK